MVLRPLTAGLVLGSILLAGAGAAHSSPPAPAAPGTAAPATVKPLWQELTPAQKAALVPLQAEWDKMDSVRKQKWLDIGNRFAGMKPDEQQRVHERMREWVKLTPEQRRQARENYTLTKKIDKSAKSAKWDEYQQLPDEEKKKLAAAAAAAKKPQVTNLPPKAQPDTRTVKPGKSGAAVCPPGTIANTAAALPACVPPPANVK